MIDTASFIQLANVSIADALTSTSLRIGVSQARGLIIPVPVTNDGLLLSFYFRNDQNFDQNGGSTILDARSALQGSWLTAVSGDFGAITNVPARYFVDGGDQSMYGSSVIVANSGKTKWVRFDIRFAHIASAGGYVYLGMNDDGSGATQPWLIANVCGYSYVPSPATLAKPLLPNDPILRLTFAGYQPGDRTAYDVTGNGNHAVIYY